MGKYTYERKNKIGQLKNCIINLKSLESTLNGIVIEDMKSYWSGTGMNTLEETVRSVIDDVSSLIKDTNSLYNSLNKAYDKLEENQETQN